MHSKMKYLIAQKGYFGSTVYMECTMSPFSAVFLKPILVMILSCGLFCLTWLLVLFFVDGQFMPQEFAIILPKLVNLPIINLRAIGIRYCMFGCVRAFGDIRIIVFLL